MPEIPMLNDLYEGRGVNPDTGQTFAVAIDFDPPKSLVEGEGQQSELTLRIITDSSQLSSSLGVSASAAVTSRMASVSAEAKFFSERTLNSYYTYALAKVTVQNPPLLIRYPRFKAEAFELLDKKQWDGFAKLYGTHYVEGYVTGGSYYALIEIQTKEASEKTEVTAKLSAAYKSIVKVKGSVDVSAALEEAIGSKSTNVYVCQSGGSGDILEVTLEEMVEQAKSFTKIVKDNPIAVRAIVNSYRTSVVPLPDNCEKPSLKLLAQKNTLEDLGKLYLKLRDYKSDLEFVLANLGQFTTEEFSQSSLKGTLEEVNQKIDDVVRIATLCADDYDSYLELSSEEKEKASVDFSLYPALPGRFDSLGENTDDSISRSAVPIGSVLPYGGDLTNTQSVEELTSRGWLPCDGKSYKISDYPELHKAIGLAFGGNNETFNVPDLRGRFLRGVDGGASQDPDAAKRKPMAQGGNAGDKVGSVQEDRVASHQHGIPSLGGEKRDGYKVIGAPQDKNTTDAYGSMPNDGGGQETRPKNIYVYYIIKSK